jgi:acetylornithine deacetylase
MHASVAAAHQNATEALLWMMLRVSRFLRDQHPEVVYNFRDLYSIASGFSAPERCEAWMDLHAPPDAPVGELVTDLEEKSLQKEDGSADFQANESALHFHIETVDAGYALPERGALVEALKTVYAKNGWKWQTGAFRSHSDANQLWAAGIKPVVLGPGRLEHAHAQDESVSFSQVCRAAKVYLELMNTGFPVESAGAKAS